MYIAIEGCVGAGKSTVASGLAKYRNSKSLLENFEVNPFLNAFYQNPTEHALETEFAFLLLHYHQLKLENSFVSQSELIADFHLGKDVLYANLNLKELRAKQLFNGLFELCSQRTPSPSLLIYLSASTDLLVRRIAERNRTSELNVDRQYFGAVNEAYDQFFRRYHGPKLRIPMDEWDFVKDEALYHRLSKLIDEEPTRK
jgi:deoxyadenosine/deoxycytidine kinase